jgi:hypothetical protein
MDFVTRCEMLTGAPLNFCPSNAKLRSVRQISFLRPLSWQISWPTHELIRKLAVELITLTRSAAASPNNLLPVKLGVLHHGNQVR